MTVYTEETEKSKSSIVAFGEKKVPLTEGLLLWLPLCKSKKSLAVTVEAPALAAKIF